VFGFEMNSEKKLMRRRLVWKKTPAITAYYLMKGGAKDNETEILDVAAITYVWIICLVLL